MAYNYNPKASETSFLPDGDITATDVQAAIAEVRSDTDTKLAGKSAIGHGHVASDVSDFDTEVSNNTDVAANTSARHDPLTLNVDDPTTYAANLSGQELQLVEAGLNSWGVMSPAQYAQLFNTFSGGNVAVKLNFDTTTTPTGPVVASKGFRSNTGRLYDATAFYLSNSAVVLTGNPGDIGTFYGELKIGDWIMITDVETYSVGHKVRWLYEVTAITPESGYYTIGVTVLSGATTLGVSDGDVCTVSLIYRQRQDADQVPFTPDGDIAATDVQAAIVEVRDDADTKLTGKSDTGHGHVASDVSDFDTEVANNSTVVANVALLNGITSVCYLKMTVDAAVTGGSVVFDDPIQVDSAFYVIVGASIRVEVAGDYMFFGTLSWKNDTGGDENHYWDVESNRSGGYLTEVRLYDYKTVNLQRSTISFRIPLLGMSQYNNARIKSLPATGTVLADGSFICMTKIG